MNKKLWILVGLVIIVIVGIVLYFLRPQLLPVALQPVDPTKEVRATVVDFGAHLKDINATSKGATTTIATTFAPYVAPELLSVWSDEPSLAPVSYGNLPWPQRIEIQSVEKQKDGSYWVTAFVIEQDKTGDYLNKKVTVVLEKVNGKWMITDFAGYPDGVRPIVNKNALKDPKYQIPG
jgi:hypothetical protein